MKKSDTSEQVITRRKALGRIGLFATAVYTVPAFATLSMAHASSSGTSGASSGTSGASSGTSGASSGTSGASTPSAASPSDVEKECGAENLNTGTQAGADYAQCLFDNGWEGFTQP